MESVLQAGSTSVSSGVAWAARSAVERELTLAGLERDYIFEVLRRAGGNKTRAAEMVGIPAIPSTTGWTSTPHDSPTHGGPQAAGHRSGPHVGREDGQRLERIEELPHITPANGNRPAGGGQRDQPRAHPTRPLILFWRYSTTDRPCGPS